MQTLPLFLVCLGVAAARADVTSTLLDQLKSEIKAEARAAREKGEEGPRHQEFYRMQEMLMRLPPSGREENSGEIGLRTACP